MNREEIAFWIDKNKKVRLEAIAAQMNCDRTRIINEAINAYLEMYQWQLEEIKQGITEADDGDFASEEEVKATFSI